MFHYLYIAQCSDKSLYVGQTNNLEAREKTHNVGNGANFTKQRLPLRIVYYEKYKSRAEAMKREKQIKKWRREKKDKLIYHKKRR